MISNYDGKSDLHKIWNPASNAAFASHLLPSANVFKNFPSNVWYKISAD